MVPNRQTALRRPGRRGGLLFLAAAAFLGSLWAGSPAGTFAADPLSIGETGERSGDRITLYDVGQGSVFCYPRPELTFATPPCAVGEGSVTVDPPQLLVDIEYCVGSGNDAVQVLSKDGPGLDDLWVGRVGGGATGLGEGWGYRYPGTDFIQESLSSPIAPGSCARGFLPFSGLGAPQLIWGEPPFTDAVVWEFESQVGPSPTPSMVPSRPGPLLADVRAIFDASPRSFQCTEEFDGEVNFLACDTLPDEVGSWGAVMIHADGRVSRAFASVLREPPGDLPEEAVDLWKEMVALFCPDDLTAMTTWIDERSRTAGETAERSAFGDCILDWIIANLGGPSEWTLQVEIMPIAAEPSDPPLSPSPFVPLPTVVPAPTEEPPPLVPGPIGGDVSSGATFAGSVPSPANVSVDPVVVARSALLALAVIFLMPFPAQLFNSTLEQHATEIRGWFAPLAGPARRLGTGFDAFWRTPLGIASFLAASALLYALLDPGFGLTAAGLVQLLGLAAAILVVIVLFAIPLVLAHRRHGDRPLIAALPGTLAVGAACVLVSRLADFQPGYLYGLVIGFAFANELEPAEQGRTGAVAAGLMLGAALLAWLGLGLLRGSGTDGLLATVAETVLAAVMVAGLEGVVFGLLPLRFLPGEPVYRWNRLVWGALLGLGTFAFFHVLINPSSGYLSDTTRTPLLTVVVLLVGFSLVSVGFWAYFRFRPARSGPGVMPPAP